jgi:copper chaperone CopZ
MKTYLFLLASLISHFIYAQEVKKVSIQASGLTCSICSNSIYKALKGLDFVDKIDANIQNSSFEITFKTNSKIDFDKLKSKVEDAGFSVSKFIATINFSKIWVNSNGSVSVGDKTLLFTDLKGHELNGDKPVQIVDKGFVSTKEYKKNAVQSAGVRTYHATI